MSPEPHPEPERKRLDDERLELSALLFEQRRLVQMLRRRTLELEDLEGERDALVERRAEDERRLAALEGEQRALADRLRGSQYEQRRLTRRLRESEVMVQGLRAERDGLVAELQRVRDSRSWRLGHGVLSVLSALTRRRSRPESALDLAIRRLDEPGEGS